MSQGFSSRVQRTARILYVLMALIVLVGDQLTKRMVAESVPEQALIPIFPGFLNITNTKNAGVAFSLFSEAPSPWKTALLISVSVALLVTVALVVWRSHELRWESGVGLALIIGGALSNLTDRIQSGRVLDFLDFYYRSYHWPTFNLADSAIVVGAGFLILHVIFAD